jgi:isopenicillin-N epimerase
MFRMTPPLLWKARTRLADYLGAQPERLVFTPNVSTAINIVASGLQLPPGGSILISDREYQAMRFCWERAARHKGLELRMFHLPLLPKSPDEIVDAVASALTPDTRLLFFSHVYSATGLITPAHDICEQARRRGVISVVDGAHAPGMIDLNIEGVQADFYAGNCHKWMLAPIGCGFLVINDEWIDRLEPLQVSWGYPRDPKRGPDEPDEFGSTPRTRQLEFEGTRDIGPWLVIPEAIDFQERLGRPAIRQRIAELQAYVRAKMDRRWEPITPDDPVMHGSMLSFWIPADRPADVDRSLLWQKRIEVPITEWPDGRMLRVSTHWYTTETEIDRLAELSRSW